MEFAVLVPVLLLIVFGTADFGLAMNTYNNETQLANEGARLAVVNKNPGPGSLQADIKSQGDTADIRTTPRSASASRTAWRRSAIRSRSPLPSFTLAALPEKRPEPDCDQDDHGQGGHAARAEPHPLQRQRVRDVTGRLEASAAPSPSSWRDGAAGPAACVRRRHGQLVDARAASADAGGRGARSRAHRGPGSPPATRRRSRRSATSSASTAAGRTTSSTSLPDNVIGPAELVDVRRQGRNHFERRRHALLDPRQRRPDAPGVPRRQSRRGEPAKLLRQHPRVQLGHGARACARRDPGRAAGERRPPDRRPQRLALPVRARPTLDDGQRRRPHLDARLTVHLLHANRAVGHLDAVPGLRVGDHADEG